ncbi:Lysosomal-associated transmembrane protein 5, partial [Frankliniella fusca]
MPATPCSCRGEDEENKWFPEVERGCCCSLQTCCKIQAIMVVASSMLYTPMVLVEYFQPRHVYLTEKRQFPCRQPGAADFSMCDFDLDTATGQRPHGGVRGGGGGLLHQDEHQARAAEIVLKILLQFIAFLSALVFLVGIKRRRPKLLLPYVRVLAVHVVFSLLALLVKACVYGMWLEAVVIILPIGVGLPYYMWLCAYSLYRRMKRAVAAEEAAAVAMVVDAEAAAPVYAAPHGFVVPTGWGWAPPARGVTAGPGAAAVAGAGAPASVVAVSSAGAVVALPTGTLLAGPGSGGPHYDQTPAPAYDRPPSAKPDDSPPPPYESVVAMGANNKAPSP